MKEAFRIRLSQSVRIDVSGRSEDHKNRNLGQADSVIVCSRIVLIVTVASRGSVDAVYHSAVFGRVQSPLG